MIVPIYKLILTNPNKLHDKNPEGNDSRKSITQYNKDYP